MFNGFGDKLRKPAARQSYARIESFESRTMLSASAAVATMKPLIEYAALASASSSSIQGYTPAQIKEAYDLAGITLGGGVAGTGAGQTIALIDAYNDPNIQSDLNVFDSQFDLSSTNLKVVNQTGGTSLPSTDAGWAGEISLDVEWAHAIAPGANILLVEAKSDSINDLMAAVNYARNAAGVSVVSMSWGGSEFFSWGGGEFNSETNLDSYFTTPAGHQGVTFIAAAGDSGAYQGVDWPAASPNVISVGGTTLTLNGNGTYSSEQSWSGTSGGYSQVESEPAYQSAVQNSGARSVPDVAYNADPNTGFAIYDSLANQGYVGWQEVGGTSAGAPQWAAIIAIADQGRVINGLGTLDGATQTIEMLYDLYSAPSTTDYTTYTTYFNDVIDQVYQDPWHWGWGGWGQAASQATAGYDTMTGLGTPHGNMIVSALEGSKSTASSGTPSTGSSSSGSSSSGSSSSSGTTTTPAALPDSPISGTFIGTLPTSVISGSDGSITLELYNTSATRFDGPITVSLYASSDTTLSSSNSAFATFTIKKLDLGGGDSKRIKFKFTYPAETSSGSFYLVGTFAATMTDTQATQAVSASTITVGPATVDLATTFNSTSPIVVTPGAEDTAVVTIENIGNTTAVGTIGLSLFTSTDGLLDSGAELLGNVLTRSIRLKANHSLTFRIHFAAPLDQPAGSYSLIASTASSLTPADGNSSNDVATIGTMA